MRDLHERPTRERLRILRDRIAQARPADADAFIEALDIIERSLSEGHGEWLPLLRCVTPAPSYSDAEIAAMASDFKLTVEEARAAVVNAMSGDWFRNDLYQVIRRTWIDEESGATLFHLSVKRLDQQPVKSWADMQQIKNEMVGLEVEAVEIYPAESRLTDTANQYHLWGVLSDGWRVPFGWHGDRVIHDTGAVAGAVQQRRAAGD